MSLIHLSLAFQYNARGNGLLDELFTGTVYVRKKTPATGSQCQALMAVIGEFYGRVGCPHVLHSALSSSLLSAGVGL